MTCLIYERPTLLSVFTERKQKTFIFFNFFVFKNDSENEVSKYSNKKERQSFRLNQTIEFLLLSLINLLNNQTHKMTSKVASLHKRLPKGYSIVTQWGYCTGNLVSPTDYIKTIILALK